MYQIACLHRHVSGGKCCQNLVDTLKCPIYYFNFYVREAALGDIGNCCLVNISSGTADTFDREQFE